MWMGRHSESRGQTQTSECKIKCGIVKTEQRPHRVPPGTIRWAPNEDYVVMNRRKIHRKGGV